VSNDKSPLEKLKEEIAEQSLRDIRRAAEDDKWYKAQAVKQQSNKGK
jgi:hypothetical protein